MSGSPAAAPPGGSQVHEHPDVVDARLADLLWLAPVKGHAHQVALLLLQGLQVRAGAAGGQSRGGQGSPVVVCQRSCCVCGPEPARCATRRPAVACHAAPRPVRTHQPITHQHALLDGRLHAVPVRQGDRCTATGQQASCLCATRSRTEQLQCRSCATRADCPARHRKQKAATPSGFCSRQRCGVGPAGQAPCSLPALHPTI